VESYEGLVDISKEHASYKIGVSQMSVLEENHCSHMSKCVSIFMNLSCVLQVCGKVKQFAKFQHRSSIHRAVMQICICHRLSNICTPKWVFFEGEDVKILCSNVLASS